MVNAFKINRTPKLIFGAGKFNELPGLIKGNTKNILVITGGKSYQLTPAIQEVISTLELSGNKVFHEKSVHEPSPEVVDRIASKNRVCEIVIAIGGGSVIDTGKAVSAMIPFEDSVFDYLEGVGTKAHPGLKTPFIAVPTTAGTGSEATSNAVISITGMLGFKKSLRHENLVPDAAIVDPNLSLQCPEEITINSGMDALTQLLESYLSVKANPFTDALALDGIRYIDEWLVKVVKDGSDIEGRTGMAYAAYLSGITLANAGLGLTHGFASSVGGFFNMPHGLVCGTLMGAVNRFNIEQLMTDTEPSDAKEKYARVGEILSGKSDKSQQWYMEFVAEYIEKLIARFKLRSLADYGVTEKDLARIVLATDHKSNPVKFDDAQLMAILKSRL